MKVLTISDQNGNVQAVFTGSSDETIIKKLVKQDDFIYDLAAELENYTGKGEIDVPKYLNGELDVIDDIKPSSDGSYVFSRLERDVY